jgi:hypothetical protein
MADFRVAHGGQKLKVYAFTNGATPTIGSLLFELESQLDTAITPTAEGAWTVTPNHVKDDAAFNEFVRTTKPLPGSGTPLESLTFESGATETQVSTSATQVFVLVRGGKQIGGTDDGKHKCFVAAAVIDPTSGGWSQSGNVYNKPALIFNTIKIESAVTVPSAVQVGISSLTTPLTITMDASLDAYGKIHFA